MNIEQQVREDLTRYNIVDEVEVLNKLDLYKVLDKESLSEMMLKVDQFFISDVGNVVRCESLLSDFGEYNQNELENIYNNFKKLEQDYDVVIDCAQFPTSLRLIYMVGSNQDNISMANVLLGSYQTQMVAITEQDFNNLTGKEQTYIPIILFNRIVAECISQGGSDIHFLTIHNEKKLPEYPIRFRVGNDMVEYSEFVMTAILQKDVLVDAVGKKSNANARDIDTPYGIQTSINDVFDDGVIELRLCCNKVQDGYHCVCRIQTKKTVSLKINELGFTKEDEYVLYRTANKRSGLTLITGAIRTGKNTTAYALGNEIVKLPVKIADYSSPIEVYMPFPQVDYMGDVNILRNCMRAAKKQDINVAFLNEIPNKEVAFAVRDLVNSSIHVITTTHIDRLWHVFYKLKELYGDDYRDLISQLNMVANQKMYKRVCQTCKTMYDISFTKKEYQEFAQDYGITQYYQGSGCIDCGNAPTLPIMEVVYFTDEIKSNLLECSTIQQMEQYIKKYMFDHHLSMEFKIADMIKHGTLTVSDLDSII